MTNSIQIIKKIPDTPLQQLKLDMAPSIEAESGAIYTLIDEQTGQYPESVELQQLGDNLHVMRDGEVLLVIEDFYDEIGQGTHQVSFDEFASIVTSNNMLSVESPMWHEEMDVVVSLDDSTTVEPSSIEQGEMLSSKSMVDNNPSEGSTGTEAVEAGSGIGWGWYAAAGLGALALGGASGSDSSSDSGSSSSSSSVTISAAAGVFFSEVLVGLYSEDGTLLSSESHDYSTGDYVYTGSYSGALLVEITDINGDDGDYTDETTGESKSLGTTLRAMATTDGGGEEAISVTPLTELATQLAGVTTGEAFTTEDVEVNDKVADLFGLDDLLEKPTVLTEDTEGADEASLKYGEALAILSGADSANGTTATETITAIAESLTNDDGSLIESEDGELQLTSEVTNILAEGLETFNESDLGGDYTISEGFDFISAPTLVDADGEGLGWINSFLVETEKDNSINVKIKGVSVGDEVTVSVGEESTSLTVTADDIVDDAYVLISIQGSWFDGEDGTYTVTVSVNEEEQDVLVKLDTQAPDNAVIALANDAGSEADDYLTSDATVNVTLAGDTVTWEYSLESGTNWVEGEGTSFELSEGTYAEGVIQVRQFDAAGNITITEFSEAVTVDLTGPNEAPTISLTEDSGSSDTDQVTSNGLVNVILTGDAVAWEYSVDAGVTWQTGTDSSFTIEEGVYGEGYVQVRQSDEAGNVSEVAELGEITVDVTAPDSTTFSIDYTTVTVTLSDDESSWEYSLDGGDSWTTGSDATFEILEDTTYATGEIQVRETDVAGNVSDVVSNEVEVLVDTSAPTAPTITLAEDTGSNDSDQVTSNGLVNVTLTGDAVAWEYSVDAGVTWQTGTDSSFTIEEGVYAEGDVQVRQSDEAGNVSEVTELGGITVDMTAPDSTAFTIDYTTVTVTLSGDENSWEYSLDGGESWTTGSDASFEIIDDSTYAAGDIQVRETDVAGNISQVTNTEEVAVVGDFFAPPSFSLYEDTGVSDSDGITDDGGVLVALSDGAVAWEYSLDGGENWLDGLGAYSELEETTTVDEDFVVYEVDSDGNQIQELDDYYIGEVIDGPLGFELSESGNGWQYSTDGGSTFITYAWEDMDGYFFMLDDDTEYPAGDIQVRQYNEEGDVSDAAVSAQDIVITDAEEETDDSEGDDGSDNEDSFFVAVDLSDSTTSWSYSLDGGTTTEYGVAYVALSSDDANVFEDDGELRLSLDDFEAYLIDSDGNQTEIDIINEEDGYIENVFAFVIDADTAGWTYSTDGGDTFITESWGDQDGNGMLVGVDADYDRYEIQITQNYDDGTTRTALVTEDVYFEGDDISYVIDAESAVIIDDDNGEYLTGTAVGDDGNFAIFTSGSLDGEEYESALLIDEDGNVAATLEGSDAFEDGQIVSLNDGKFIIFNENVINLYSSTGELLNTATTEFSDYDEIYVVEAIDDGYVAFIKDFATIEGVKYDYLYANTYDSDGVLQSTTEDLIVTSTDVGITDLFVEAFSDGSFVATWAERNDASTESQTYLQAFNANGTTDGSQITIFETNDQGWTNLNSSDFQIIASGDGGYIVLGKYDIENEETGLDDGRYYFEIYVDSDGNATSLYDSDEGNISSSALFVGDEGDFVIAHNLVEVSGYGINVQRYNADGSTDGDAILLEADEHSFDRDPTVSALDDGGYQVEWLSDVYVDGETVTIVSVQEFSSTGELLDDTTEVLIDLVGDDSTEVGTFSADETYEIYINIDVTVTEDLNAVEATWSGAENLGDDDIIILINDFVDAFSNADDELTWSLEDGGAFLTGSAVLDGEGEFSVSDTFTTDLWDGEWSATPNNGLGLADVAIDDYPSDV